MSHPPAHPDAGLTRVLFVLASLGEDEAAELQDLARHLPRDRCRIDVIPCARTERTWEQAPERLVADGVRVDTTPYGLSFEDTVAYLARRLPHCEVVVSGPDVPDLPPALERLAIRPPLVEHGTFLRKALGGPQRLMSRPAVGRWAGPTVAPLWERLLAEAAAAPPAPKPSLFRSFVQGGWECSTHVRRDGRRLDVIAAVGHDLHAEADYRQLGGMGLRTMRDGLRWHLIERGAPGAYDWSSWTPMLEAARRTGAQVIWDLLHYGWPDELDIWSPAFVDRFAAFARAAARHRREISDEVPWWCPINEISFHAWGGGDVGYLNPFAHRRGFELKCQLARASIAAMEALRDVDARARFVHCEPTVAIHHDDATGRPRWEAEGFHEAQFQAFDLLSGRLWPQIGGRPDFLDVIGVNYYWNNQWIHGHGTIDVDHPTYAPLSDLLFAMHARYGRPVLVAETGTEGDRRGGWFTYVAGEALRARARGVPVEGVCLYPVADHPGWDDDRACPNGLVGPQPCPGGRMVHAPLAEAVARVRAEVEGDAAPAQDWEPRRRGAAAR